MDRLARLTHFRNALGVFTIANGSYNDAQLTIAFTASYFRDRGLTRRDGESVTEFIARGCGVPVAAVEKLYG